MIRIFIGYDRNETVAYHVLANSIMRQASRPVQICPLILGQLPMSRERAEYQSTDFSFSRFLVPWLCGYRGRAIFMDCDMLCMADIAELWDNYFTGAVSVVKHDYKPIAGTKFLDQAQSTYEKKNWSSLMLFENEQCQALTPKYVNSASGMELHQFKWLDGDDKIGVIPQTWNHLVSEYPKTPHVKMAHFTLGTPCFKKYQYCEYAKEWYDEYDAVRDYNAAGEFSKLQRVGT